MRVLFFLLFLPLVQVTYAQIMISGVVTEKSGNPLLGVNVYLSGTYDGATTGLDGSFTFTTYETDSLVLVASYIGYHESVIAIEPKSQQLNIQLKEEVNELNAVVITAGAFNASEESKRVVMKPLDIVTTAGATADIPGALNTLPGTQTVGETGRLFVRGGDGRETKTFIDGMLVHNEYTSSVPNTPGRSRFSPFMFKGMSFSTGGYSAEYGQALSSALILQSKDRAENDRTDISIMSVGGDVSATRSFGNSSLAGKVQYTNLTPYFSLISQRLDWDKAPTEYNANVAYRLQPNESGMLKVYANVSTSDMELYEEDIANPGNLFPVAISNDYRHINVSYRQMLNEKWGIRAGGAFTRNDDNTVLEVEGQCQKLSGYHAKTVVDYQRSDRVALLFGSEVLSTNLDQELTSEYGSQHQAFNEGIVALFMEAELFASSALAFKPGIRMEYNNLTDQVYMTPRFSAAYKTGTYSQTSLAYGLFRQSPAQQIKLTDPTISSELATHYIANYQWIKEGRSFRVEAYEKRYGDLVKYQNVYDAASFRSDGDGFARGLELFWRDSRTLKEVDYWVSYSYLDTEREYADFPGSFTPAFASAHNFSLVVKKFFDELRTQTGLTYSYASRRRYNDLNSEVFMGGKTPAYYDLSFNVSYLYSSQVIIHAMVNNVLGTDNIFGYEYAAEPNEMGVYASRPIMPAAKRFIFLGVFVTLSKNKGINQLPNL